MNEEKQTAIRFVPGLIILALIVAVAIQTYFIVGMKKQIDSLQNDPAHSVHVYASEDERSHSQRGSVEPDVEHEHSETATRDPVEDQQKYSQRPRYPTQPYPYGPNRAIPRHPFADEFFNQHFDSRLRDPYEEIYRMQQQMDRVFNNSFGPLGRDRHFDRFFDEGFSTPEIDVRENEKQYMIIVNLPGTDESNVSVQLDGGVLTVKGEQDLRKDRKNDSGETVYRERRSGIFQRSITFPGPVIESSLQTNIENGVLTITIEKDNV